MFLGRWKAMSLENDSKTMATSSYLPILNLSTPTQRGVRVFPGYDTIHRAVA
jgi:hypothetical protein